ncbi:UNVERIFIED_CONTAM: hypothetical protein RMT77_001188 [Armadillidium vulgare]
MGFNMGSNLVLKRIKLKLLHQNSLCIKSFNCFSVLVDKSCNSVIRKELYNTPLKQVVRWKAPKFSKLVGTLGVRRSRIMGVMIDDGEWVSAGTILVKQYGVQFFPGLNVGMARNRHLFAMEHGKVYITTEKVNPNWNNKLMLTFFGQYQNKDVPIYRTYFHIIAASMPQKFNLIDQV